MKKIIVLLLILGALNVNGAIELEHDKTEIYFDHACSYYSVTSDSALELKSYDIDADFIMVKGNMLRYKIQSLQEIDYKVFRTGIVGKTCSVSANESSFCENELSSYSVDITRHEWKPFKGYEISDTPQKFRICGYFRREFKDGAYSVEIDNIPIIKGVEFSQYAWYNNSYAYRINVTPGSNPHNLPLLLNNSQGFNLGDPSDIQWAWARGEYSVYFNNNTDWLYASDTAQQPFEIENGTHKNDYNITAIWEDNHLVLHFHNKSGRRIRDSGIVDHQISMNDSTLWASGSKFDYGLDFSSRYSWVNLDNVSFSAVMDGSHDFSVEFWLWYGETLTAQENIFGARKDKEFEIILLTAPNRIYANWKIGGLWKNVQSGVINTSTWMHVVVTYDSSTGGKLYLNCKLEDSDATTGALNGGSLTHNIIGAHGNAGQYWLNQGIDEFRIWNKTLNITEIGYLCDDYLYFENATETILNETNETAANDSGIFRIVVVDDKNIFNEDTQLFIYQNCNNVTRFIKLGEFNNETTLAGNLSYLFVLREGHIVETADQLQDIRSPMWYYIIIFVLIIMIVVLAIYILWRRRK